VITARVLADQMTEDLEENLFVRGTLGVNREDLMDGV
jgi:hypothetical protein